MNRKHLIQFVAIVGAVLVLYVLSFGPMMAYALRKWEYYSSKGTYEGNESANALIFKAYDLYRPIVWACEQSSTAGRTMWLYVNAVGYKLPIWETIPLAFRRRGGIPAVTPPKVSTYLETFGEAPPINQP